MSVEFDTLIFVGEEADRFEEDDYEELESIFQNYVLGKYPMIGIEVFRVEQWTNLDLDELKKDIDKAKIKVKKVTGVDAEVFIMTQVS